MRSSSAWRRPACPKNSARARSWSGSSPRPCCASCSRASPSNCWRSSACCSPAVCCCCGCAGRCGANCAGLAQQDTEAALGRRKRHVPRKTFAQAAWQIVVADVSMSLDNVLAVAGAARDHPVALVFGLGLSIVLMGVGRQLHRAAAQPASLDCLCRSGDHPLRRRRHDLARRAGSVAACVRLEPVVRQRGGERGRGRPARREHDARRERAAHRARFRRIRSATRRAIAGAGSSQSTGQGATARKRSISSG